MAINKQRWELELELDLLVQRRRLLAFLAGFPMAIRAAGAPSRPRIVLASLVTKSDSFGARWLELIYTDAFNRLGVELEIQYYPPARAAAEAASGNVDGELLRSFDYTPAKGNLLRVAEPTVFGAVGAYARRPGIVLHSGWTSLRHTDYRINYRYGYTVIRSRLAGVVPASHTAPTHNTETGMRKLMVERADIYIDYRDIADYALRSEEFKDSGIYLVATLERVPFHAFLNRRFADLVPRLSRVLKEMHGTGLIMQYRRQALAEYHAAQHN